jgi:hypothetical protein
MKTKLLLAGLALAATSAFAQLPPWPPGLSSNSQFAIGRSTNGTFSVSNPVPAAAVTWNPSPTPGVGYNVFYGAKTATYTNVVDAGTNLSAVVPNLAFGTTYFFAVTSYSTAGLESGFSNEASYTTPAPPGGVQLVTLTVFAASSLGGPWSVLATVPAGAPVLAQQFYRVGLTKSGP